MAYEREMLEEMGQLHQKNLEYEADILSITGSGDKEAILCEFLRRNIEVNRRKMLELVSGYKAIVSDFKEENDE